jgi:hypothetical protein
MLLASSQSWTMAAAQHSWSPLKQQHRLLQILQQPQEQKTIRSIAEGSY